ncbi:MAG: transcriptional repressor LexA [Verrucomicrobiota bacterium]
MSTNPSSKSVRLQPTVKTRGRRRGTRGSDSRQLVLNFIGSYTEENNRPPTVREIQQHCGFKSPRAVSYILEKLEEAKKIIRQAHSRGIQLIDETGHAMRSSVPAMQLPLFDSIPAGLGDSYEGGDAPEQIRFVPSTLGISDPKRAYAVKVRGDSMVGAGILDGDVVILEQREAKENDIVAALIDGENTLKRLVKKGSGLFLKAENPDYPDLHPVQQLSSQGVVVSVMRNLQGAIA